MAFNIFNFNLPVISSIIIFLLFFFSQQPKINNNEILAILMYHHIDTKPGRYSISPANFRKHLKMLYDAGFRTTKLETVINNPEILKNKKSVILRFDDSKKSHFKYIHAPNGELTIDPDCAVGIILDFNKKYPEFGKNALFCIIPHEEFHQPKWTKKKIEFLLNNGMELANHSYYHKDLTNAKPEEAEEDFGKAMAYWEKVIGSLSKDIKYIAPPQGKKPHLSETLEKLKHFTWQNKEYITQAILYAGRNHNTICPNPNLKAFDRYNLPCLEVNNSNFDSIVKFLS